MEGFNLKSEKGNMMMILIGSVVMLATLGFILANIVSSSSKVASLDADEQRAFYAAQSGMEYGLKEYLTADNVDEWTVNDMDGGSGLTLDVSLQKVGNDQIIITSTGKGNNTSKTVQTIISKADSNYVPDYAVFSKKPVVNVVTKDSIAGVYNPGLIYENAASAPVFDNDVLRNLAKQTQEDGNSYYFENDLVVDENFNPPDGTVVFTEGKLKFAKGVWTGDVFFVAMDDIGFQSTWRNSEDVKMVVYSGQSNKKIWIEPRNLDDDPVEFIIRDGEVIPGEPYAARIDVIGAALPMYFLFWQYNSPITVNCNIGGESIYPFGPNPTAFESNLKAKVDQGNVNQGDFPKQYVFPNIFEAGTRISVNATSWEWKWFSGSQYKLHMNANSANSSDATTIIKTLRDGDPVPNIEGFGNQASAAEFIENYIDFETQTVTLDENQAIYLIELYTYDLTSSAADFQDVVILVSLAKEPTDFIITPGDEEVVAENILPFKGGIISHGSVYGLRNEIINDEELITRLEVVRDEQILKDFLKYSVNGNARVILESKWVSKN
ncbi:MAG: hypothetical protein H6627_01995 [Calditrichae bacterium]|nr:hypothetical protein [Calditrichota bacterium]MCB9057305.1 hypothetical protein [Calditrichia bacterium]